MTDEILFSEKQRFKQWWLWLLLLGINGVLIYGIFKQIIIKEFFGNNPMSNLGLLITTAITLLITFFFINFRLETIIKKDGIYVRFFPIHSKYKYYPWKDLTAYSVRKYSPLKEYGGWGIRYGLSGKTYNISGNKGLQLELSDQTKLLIGTNKPEKLKKVLSKIKS